MVLTTLVFGILVYVAWVFGGAFAVMAYAAVLGAERWDTTRSLRLEQKAQRRELFRDWGFALQD
jgi:hypothetical protein